MDINLAGARVPRGVGAELELGRGGRGLALGSAPYQLDLDRHTTGSPIPSPESQVKVRAESSVNMMATACLLVSLGSRVTHLTLLISVTWHGIHRGLSQGEPTPATSPAALPPPGGPVGPQDSE